MSQIGRRLGRSGLALTVEACLRAIEDAGLSPDDIDGVASYPGAAGGGPGFSGAGSTQLHDALGLRTRWHLGTGETGGQLGPVMDAALAVAVRCRGPRRLLPLRLGVDRTSRAAAAPTRSAVGRNAWAE